MSSFHALTLTNISSTWLLYFLTSLSHRVVAYNDTSQSTRCITVTIGDSIVVYPESQRSSGYECFVVFFPIGDFFLDLPICSLILISKDHSTGELKGSIDLVNNADFLKQIRSRYINNMPKSCIQSVTSMFKK